MLACRTPPCRRLPGKTTITLVPSASNWPCTSPLALWPIETIVVTAAMPMTTPEHGQPGAHLVLAQGPQGDAEGEENRFMSGD